MTSRIGFAQTAAAYATCGPNPAHERQLDMAETEYDDIRQRLDALMHERIPAFEAALDDIGAPWTPTRMLPPLWTMGP